MLATMINGISTTSQNVQTVGNVSVDGDFSITSTTTDCSFISSDQTSDT